MIMARRDPEPEVIEPEVVEVELPFISEGTAKEIELYGFAVHPQTGQRVGAESLPAGRSKA